jgi:hypothetical protein
VPFEPENVEGHIGWRAGATEEVVELRSAGLVGSDHLAVDYGVIDLERERDLIAECIEAVKGIAVARDEAATGLLEIAERAEAVVLEIEPPVGVVERLFSPGRDNRLYPRQCHPADIARSADFVQ